MRPGQCPVCRAGFRGVAQCTRCGADLSRLMALTVYAWRLREAAADAFRSGDYAGAAEAAAVAEQVAHSPRGAALAAIARWLATENWATDEQHGEEDLSQSREESPRNKQMNAHGGPATCFSEQL